MKKWLATLGIITCVFGLTGCGAKETKITGDPVDSSVESQLISFGESYVTGVAQAADAGQASAYADNDAITAAIESYDSVKEDIGTINGFRSDDEYVVMPDDSTYEIVIGYDGSDHDGYVTLNVDSTSGTLTSMQYNVNYSFGELMGQAGLNTVLGMGTTFVILILLALLISLFKFIPNGQTKKKAAAKEEDVTPEQALSEAAEEAPAEDLTDDGELVAVIAAAIAASEGKRSTSGFQVRSIRKSRNR